MGRIDRSGRVGVPPGPPFQTVGTGGIRLGRLPRWLKSLTKLVAILDLGTQSRLARTPPPEPGETSFSAAKDGQSAPNPPGASNERHAPGGYRYRWPVRDQVDQGGFFGVPGGVNWPKKVIEHALILTKFDRSSAGLVCLLGQATGTCAE